MKNITQQKKTVIIFAAFLFYFSNAFSQVTSNLVVFSEDGNPFYLVINGIKQNIEPKTNIKVTGLTNNSNYMRILFSNEKIPSLDKKIYFDTMGFEATMRITRTKKKGYKLRFFGDVPLNQAPIDNNQYITNYSSTNSVSSGSNTNNSNVNSGVTNNSGTTNSSATNPPIEISGTNSNNATNNSNTTINTTPIATNVGSSNLPFTALNYNWKIGTSHHFSALQIDNISTSMIGMNVNEQIKTTTDFVLLINAVASNGMAKGIIYLVNYKVIDSKNNILASINDIPKSAIQGEVSVDKKGHFTFLKKVYLITSGASNVLAYGSATDNSLQFGGEAGNVKVDAYAEFNPKTGALKAGYNIKEIKTTKKVVVSVNQETEMIDVFPYDFLELLVLPEGIVKQEDKIKVKTGIYVTDMTINSVQNGLTQFNTKLATDKSLDMFGGVVNGGSNDSQINMEMNGMEGMELSAEDQQAMGMMNAMAPEISCDINTIFNHEIGMFQSVSGTVNTTINTMGMKMTVQSVLEMKKM